MSQSTTKTIVDWMLQQTAKHPCNIGGVCASPGSTRQWIWLVTTWAVLLSETTESGLPPLQPYLGRVVADSSRDVIGWITILTSGRDALLNADPTLLDKRVSRYIPGVNVMLHQALEGDVDAFRRLLQLSSYPRKCEFPRADLKEAALAKYLACEEHAKETFERIPEWALERVRQIIERWFSPFHINDYRPHHGPGAVAEPGVHTVREKYDSMRYVRKLDTLLHRLGLGPLASYVDTDTARQFAYGEGSLVARLIFVPKTYKALRTVKPEPSTLQYSQKGVQDDLYRYIVRHPYLSKRIPLLNQGQNREAAREGSLTGLLATLDLSAASDSVSAELAHYLFQDTELGAWMEATRSEYVLLPTGEVMPTAIFAGMGSSLCFPVESIIFAAICELCYEKAQESALCIHPVDRYYTVYGDDIIVPTTWAGPVTWLLERFGFTVNKEKSYSTGSFRESCGVEAFNGANVTPFLYPFSFIPSPPRRGNHWHRSPEFASCLVDAANRSILEYGLSELRYAFLYLGEHWKYDKFVYTSRLEHYRREHEDLWIVPSTLQLWSPNPSNSSLPTRWNESYQRNEVYGYTVYTSIANNEPRLDERDEVLALWETLRRGSVPEAIDPYSALRATQVHLSRRWAGCE